MLISDASEGYLLLKASHCSETTITTDETKLRQFRDFLDDIGVGDIDVSDVTPEQISAFLRHEEARGLSRFTTKRQYASLSAFFSWCCDPDIDLAHSDPTDAVPAPKPPKKTMDVYSIPDDIEALLQAARESGCPRRDKSIVLSLLDLCCRSSELAGVKIPDVHWKSGKVKVTGKGNKSRFLSLGQRALACLFLYVREERPEPLQGNFIYLTREGYPMDRGSLYQTVRRLGERAGVHATCHKFRHSGLLERLRLGMDLMTLRDYAGHTDVQVTQKYLTALSSDDIQRVAKRTSPADRYKLG